MFIESTRYFPELRQERNMSDVAPDGARGSHLVVSISISLLPELRGEASFAEFASSISRPPHSIGSAEFQHYMLLFISYHLLARLAVSGFDAINIFCGD